MIKNIDGHIRWVRSLERQADKAMFLVSDLSNTKKFGDTNDKELFDDIDLAKIHLDLVHLCIKIKAKRKYLESVKESQNNVI